MTRWWTWREAGEWTQYGAGGFFSAQPPVHTSARFAEALLIVVKDVDRALGRPPALDVVSAGAGTADLLAGIVRRAPAELAARLRLTAVAMTPRPDDLDQRITWASAVPRTVSGVVVLTEWLNRMPVDVVELTADGPRLTLVDPRTGMERPGPPPRESDLCWLDRWWPLRFVGERAETGRSRDDAWAAVVRSLSTGVALAVDYAHDRSTRPPDGTLIGHRAGRQVRPVPDGSCDITAQVALDACAAAGEKAGATATVLAPQRTALRALGVLGRRPRLAQARSDPAAYLRALQRASLESELLDRTGLFWLTQTVGVDLPTLLR